MVTPAGKTAARREATVALTDVASHLYTIRETLRKRVLVGCGVAGGYTVEDAAFVLGMTVETFNALAWPER